MLDGILLIAMFKLVSGVLGCGPMAETPGKDTDWTPVLQLCLFKFLQTAASPWVCSQHANTSSNRGAIQQQFYTEYCTVSDEWQVNCATLSSFPAIDMVQPWAELDVAGVGLSFANWMTVVSP